jgi:hypothetical protein
LYITELGHKLITLSSLEEFSLILFIIQPGKASEEDMVDFGSKLKPRKILPRILPNRKTRRRSEAEAV